MPAAAGARPLSRLATSTPVMVIYTRWTSIVGPSGTKSPKCPAKRQRCGSTLPNTLPPPIASQLAGKPLGRSATGVGARWHAYVAGWFAAPDRRATRSSGAVSRPTGRCGLTRGPAGRWAIEPRGEPSLANVWRALSPVANIGAGPAHFGAGLAFTSPTIDVAARLLVGSGCDGV